LRDFTGPGVRTVDLDQPATGLLGAIAGGRRQQRMDLPQDRSRTSVAALPQDGQMGFEAHCVADQKEDVAVHNRWIAHRDEPRRTTHCRESVEDHCADLALDDPGWLVEREAHRAPGDRGDQHHDTYRSSEVRWTSSGLEPVGIFGDPKRSVVDDRDRVVGLIRDVDLSGALGGRQPYRTLAPQRPRSVPCRSPMRATICLNRVLCQDAFGALQGEVPGMPDEAPPVLKSRCCKLVKDQLWIVGARAGLRSGLPRL
jgi:hypothetical protein